MRPDTPPVHIIPASIGYDRVLEVPSLTRELGGAPKQPESMAGILRGARALRERYGFVNVQFGEPLEVRSFLAARGYDRPDVSPALRRRAIRSLGYHSIARSGSVTAVTPTCLCAAGLLVPGTRGVSRAEAARHRQSPGPVARLAGARFTGTPWRTGRPLDEPTLEETVELLGRDSGVSVTGKGDETVYVVLNAAQAPARVLQEPDARAPARRGHAGHGAARLRAGRGRAAGCATRCERGHEFLLGLLRPQFVHRAGEPTRALARERRAPARRGGPGELGQGSPAALAREPRRASGILAALLEGPVEGCGATARALSALRGGPRLRRPLELEVCEQLARWNLTGELRRTEACHAGIVHTTIDWLCEQGILAARGAGAGQEVGLTREHGDGRSLELLGQHTERLLGRRAA